MLRFRTASLLPLNEEIKTYPTFPEKRSHRLHLAPFFLQINQSKLKGGGFIQQGRNRHAARRKHLLYVQRIYQTVMAIDNRGW
jgi:hypothetical protein